MKKQQKTQKAKESRTPKKRKKLEDSDEDLAPPSRKGKKKAKAVDEDDNTISLTGYIRVLKPTPALPPSRPRARQPKANPETLYITRGPFKFSSNCSFDDFLSILSQTLPCPSANIVLDKTEWKPQTPANRAMLPLGGAVGFEVLQEQISECKDKTVILCMPGPRKPAEDAPV